MALLGRCMIAVASVFILLAKTVTAAELDSSVVFINCAPGKYGDSDDYAQAVETSMTTIIHQTGLQDGNLYTKAIQGKAVCFGHGRCEMHTTIQGCSDCLDWVRRYMIWKCRNSRGVHCKQRSCEFRYEDYAFDDG